MTLTEVLVALLISAIFCTTSFALSKKLENKKKPLVNRFQRIRFRVASYDYL